MAVHWCGTGLSAIPGLKKLILDGNNVIVWNRTVSKARKALEGLQVTIYEFDIKALEEKLSPKDIIVSMLPGDWHVPLAKLAISKKAHFVSSSYISPEMRNLNNAALKAEVSLINEIGLDPGIDHLMAHKLIEELKVSELMNAETEVSFLSYCGGVPKTPNDFKYKFSWSPVGVIKALNNDAKFINNFQTVVKTPYKNIGKYSVNDEIYEAYPNRDSTPYIKEYNFDQQWNLKEFVRGTLRLNGWENAWKDIFEMLSNKSPDLDTKINNLGEELWKKHPYSPGEEDRVVLYVNLLAHQNNREVFNKYYFLDEKGSGENTAMGVLVSITLSCAIDLIIEKKLESGVQAAPYDENLINYFFKTFEEYNIVIKNSL